MPVVSVVIPTHNRAGLVGSAIESVLNQTFRDFEVIVVDDASDDDTETAVRRFHDHRIQYKRHDVGMGVSAARNTAIRHSQGDYLAFLDDDDEWLPEKLRLQVQFLETSGPDLGGVFTAGWSINTVTGKRSLLSLGACSPDDLSRNRITTSSMLLRRRCVDVVGVFDERMPCRSDYDLWIRVSQQFRLGYIRDPLFNYYVHQNALSGRPATLIRGMEILTAKHRDFLATNAAEDSRRHRFMGMLYSEVGDASKARGAFLRAAQIDPWEIRNYFWLFLSLLGPTKFRKVKAFKKRWVAGF